jgi:hypothetical protein
MGDVADRGEERRVDHRRPDAEHRTRGEPRAQAAQSGDRDERDPLEHHAPHDEPLPADAIAERAGPKLRHAPSRWVDEREQTDLADRQTGRREEEREQTPRQPVVEVVDEPRLTGARQRRIAPAHAREQPRRVASPGVVSSGMVVCLRLVPHVPHRVANEQLREGEPQDDRSDTEVEGLRPQPVARRDLTGRIRGERHRQIAGELVQAHGEPALSGPDEVDLLDDGGRPREPLVHPKQNIREHNPRPGRGPDHEKGHRDANEPAGDQDSLAAELVSELAGEEVRHRLDDSERRDERQRSAFRREAELPLGE